uniref:Uncharacterized protein n=1 Tax=Anguilla anguilla TaxID=7936 RepID=A0A0E9SB39_ANGAN
MTSQSDGHFSHQRCPCIGDRAEKTNTRNNGVEMTTAAVNSATSDVSCLRSILRQHCRSSQATQMHFICNFHLKMRKIYLPF